MKVEIDNTREVKEVAIGSDGSILAKLPEYAGYVAKIVVLDQKGRKLVILENNTEIKRTVEEDLLPTIIEGKRYVKGQKRSRQTAKNFCKLITNNLNVEKYTQSWLHLENKTYIRYSSSVVYDGAEGDFLWFSFSYNDLVEHMNVRDVTLCFLVRKSQKLVYIKADDVFNELKRARESRDNDWMHIHLIFTAEKLKFHVKTGKGNEPIEIEFLQSEHYIRWERFLNMIGGN